MDLDQNVAGYSQGPIKKELGAHIEVNSLPQTAWVLEEDPHFSNVNVPCGGLYDIFAEDLRRELVKGLTVGPPIQPAMMRNSRAFGDNLIIYSALEGPYRLFLKRHGIELNTRGPFLRTFFHFDEGLGVNMNENWFDLSEAIAQLELTTEVAFSHTEHLYRKLLSNNARALGVTDMLLEMPLPVLSVRDHGPLAYFDKERVVSSSAEISRKREGAPHCVIMQAGSSKIKKFSPQQVGEVIEVFRQQKPDYFISILTDERINPAMFDPVADNQAVRRSENILYFDRDNINEWLGACADADVILSTDSGPAHAGASAQYYFGKFKPRRSVRVLYTNADPGVWGIPGALHVRSHVISEYSKDLRVFWLNGLIGGQSYLDLSRRLGILDSSDLIDQIPQKDLERFISRAVLDEAVG